MSKTTMDVQPIDQAALDSMTAQAQVLESDDGQPVVWMTADQNIVKRFARKPGLSSDRLKPYALRFVKNAQALNELNVKAPHIQAVYKLQDTGDHIVVYRALEGDSLSQLAEQGRFDTSALADFLAHIHRLGVSFRSIHLSNILKLDDGEHGLIDITDVKFYSRPLSVKEAAANLGYVWCHSRDAQYLTPERIIGLTEAYIEAAGLPESQAEQFRQALQTQMRRGAEKRARRRARKSS